MVIFSVENVTARLKNLPGRVENGTTTRIILLGLLRFFIFFKYFISFFFSLPHMHVHFVEEKSQHIQIWNFEKLLKLTQFCLLSILPLSLSPCHHPLKIKKWKKIEACNVWPITVYKVYLYVIARTLTSSKFFSIFFFWTYTVSILPPINFVTLFSPLPPPLKNKKMKKNRSMQRLANNSIQSIPLRYSTHINKL